MIRRGGDDFVRGGEGEGERRDSDQDSYVLE